MTPWLALSDLAKYSWSLRTLLGGWLRCLMLFTAAVGIGHQYLTNSLVTPALVPTRCVFEYGATFTDDPGDVTYVPGPEYETARLVYLSQLSMLKNGGKPGIYKHLFTDNMVDMFRPDTSDIYGAWHCHNVGNVTVPWPSKAELTGPGSGMTQREFSLYWNTSAHVFRPGYNAMHREGDDNHTQAFLIWSTENSTTMNSIRAAVLNHELSPSEPPQAISFDCALALNQTVPLMNVSSVLADWVTTAFGYQTMCTSMRDCKLWLELTLDAMTTLSFRVNTSNIDPYGRIGCVVEGSEVSVGILIVLCVVEIFLLCIALALCYELWESRRTSNRATATLPFDLSDWQLATYSQANGRLEPTLRDLRDLFVRYESSDETFRLSTKSDDGRWPYRAISLYLSQALAGLTRAKIPSREAVRLRSKLLPQERSSSSGSPLCRRPPERY